jgi:hypothetical protein
MKILKEGPAHSFGRLCVKRNEWSRTWINAKGVFYTVPEDFHTQLVKIGKRSFMVPLVVEYLDNKGIVKQRIAKVTSKNPEQ